MSYSTPSTPSETTATEPVKSKKLSAYLASLKKKLAPWDTSVAANVPVRGAFGRQSGPSKHNHVKGWKRG